MMKVLPFFLIMMMNLTFAMKKDSAIADEKLLPDPKSSTAHEIKAQIKEYVLSNNYIELDSFCAHGAAKYIDEEIKKLAHERSKDKLTVTPEVEVKMVIDIHSGNCIQINNENIHLLSKLHFH